MRYRAVLAVVSVGGLLLAGCGTLRKPPDPDRGFNIRTAGGLFEAANGYRFASLPEYGAPLVHLLVRYPVGSAEDPPGKEGLAHLVEHLLYEIEIDWGGTRTSIGAELGRLALDHNAATWADHTDYTAVFPAAALDEVISLEVTRLAVGCAGLTPEIVAREREVVLNELRERQGASGAEYQRVVNEALYPAGHPYRAVDSVATVAKLELADVCGFLAGPYQRGQAFVIASGGLTNDALQRAASHHYGALPRRDLGPRPAPPTAPLRPGTVKLKAGVDEPTLLVTWPLPPKASREYRLLALGWDTIADRLDAFAVRYGWGDGAHTFEIGGDHAPVLAVAIGLRSSDKFDDAIDAAKKSAVFSIRALHKSGEDKTSPGWQRRWQGGAEALIARWESLADRNDLMGDFLQYDRDESFLTGRIDELVQAGPKETRELTEKWLGPARARFLLLEPVSASNGRRVVTYQGGAEAHGARVDPGLADVPLSLPAASLVLDTERYQTANGLQVIMWPHGAMPLTRGRLVVASGSAHDPAGKEGIADLVGADLVGADSMVFEQRSLSTRVDDLIESLGLELRAPGYELSDEAKDVLRHRLRAPGRAERRASDHAFLTALYGDGHPYARVGMTEQSMGQISRDAVMAWARARIVPRNTTLILAGQLDPPLIRQYIAYNTDQVGGGSHEQPLAAAPRPRAAWLAGVTAEPSPTVELEIGFVGGAGLDLPDGARLVLAAVLDSKLARLREGSALTYGVSASYEPRLLGGRWRIVGAVDAARAAEGARALMAVLDELRRDPASYRAEFVLARQKVLQSLLSTATDPRAVTDRLVQVAQFDLADNFYDRLVKRVSRLVVKDLQPLIADELDASGQVFRAFGNADAVQTALRGAGAP